MYSIVLYSFLVVEEEPVDEDEDEVGILDVFVLGLELGYNWVKKYGVTYLKCTGIFIEYIFSFVFYHKFNGIVSLYCTCELKYDGFYTSIKL